MKTLLRRFGRDVSGSTAIEYVLLGSIVAIAIIVAATSLGGAMNGSFENANGTYAAGLAGGGVGGGE